MKFKILATCLMLSLLTACTTIVDKSTKDSIQLNEGKRSFGTWVNDEQLETVAAVNIRKASNDLRQANIDVAAYNGIILLTGQVADAEARSLAGITAADVKGARQVFNEIQIQGSTAFLARSNDLWLTTKVKTRLLANKDIDGSRVKIVTEEGVVYMLGLLSQTEADKIARVISTTAGVQKVIKAVEYLD